MKKTLWTLVLATVLLPLSVNAQVTTFPWTEDFESSTTPAGITFTDNDGDGNNWFVNYQVGGGYGHSSSDGMLMSASYNSQTQTALTPDNWMMLPSFAIPASSAMTLTWWEKGQDANYADEYYSVYVNTTGNTVSDFTATTAVYAGLATGAWTKRSVDLSSYAGQTIYIAFRHHNCTDMFYLDIDDIRVGGPSTPEVRIADPGEIVINEPVTFTALSDGMSFAWTVDGTAQNSTTNTMQYTFTTGGTHTVIVEAINTVGSSFDTLQVNVVSCDGIAAFPWEESFEGSVACWKITLGDSTDDFQYYNDSRYANSGSKFIYMYNQNQTANAWAISPQLQIPANASLLNLSYYAVISDRQGVLNKLEVRISTTGNDTANFNTVLLVDTATTGSGYEIRNVSLAQYAGQSVYIAFINRTPAGGYAIQLDDIRVGSPEVTLDGPATAIVNTAVTFTATTANATSFAWTVDGTAQSETGETLSYTFTTGGEHTVSVVANFNGTTVDPVSTTITIIDCSAPITNFPWNESFEGNTDCWSFVNGNTGDRGFYIYTDQRYAHSGQTTLFGAYSDDYDVNQWAISPLIQLPENATNYNLHYYVSMSEYEGIQTSYEVLLSDGSADTADFSNVIFTETGSSQTEDGYEFVGRNIDLSQYAGQTIRFAFHNITGQGGDVMLVDDIRISNTLGINAANDVQVSIYPNPVSTVMNVRAEGVQEIQVIDVNGRIVLSSERAGQVDMSRLADGMYMVRVVCANGVHTSKVIKK